MTPPNSRCHPAEWPAILNIEKPVLAGRLVTLRPLNSSDAAAMHASLHDEELARLTGTQAAHSLADVTAHLLRCETADDRIDFAIMAEGKPVGEAVLNHIDRPNLSGSFRIAVWNAVDRNRGFGSEATNLVVKYGFESVGLNRIELEVFSFNPRARHVYEQAGFVHEGTRREALFWKGEWVDAQMMAMLRSDFARLSR